MNLLNRMRKVWAIVLTYNFLLVAGILLTISPTGSQQHSSPHWQIAAWGILFVVGAALAVAGSISRNSRLEFSGLVPLTFAISIFAVAYMTAAFRELDITAIGLSFYLASFATGALARLLQVYFGAIRRSRIGT